MISCIATILAGCNNNTDNIQQETKDSEEVIQPNAQATFEVVEEEAIEEDIKITNNKFINGHEFVDLGLSVKWATCNVGANEPHEFGDYYAWGETKTKSSYKKDNSLTYEHCMGNIISGDENYDVAQTQWGGSWRMPTKKEMEELINNCTWTWDRQGCKITGSNGNSILLPHAGFRAGVILEDTHFCGNYWTSSTTENDKCRRYNAYSLSYDFRHKSICIVNLNRSIGHSIRPVSD